MGAEVCVVRNAASSAMTRRTTSTAKCRSRGAAAKTASLFDHVLMLGWNRFVASKHAMHRCISPERATQSANDLCSPLSGDEGGGGCVRAAGRSEVKRSLKARCVADKP
jgi:hypothetical protein